MNKKLIFENWGIIDYQLAYKKQLNYFEKNIEKKQKLQQTDNFIIFVEHPHVYTLGKHGNQNNLIVSDDFLKKINAKFYNTDRGGDITYHGFGQIVIYPIIDLDNFNIHIKKYIFLLEEIVIQTLKEYKINAQRLDNAPGIWLLERQRPEKICAIGVKTSKNITMHGLAFNVNTNLDYFKYINPCGFTDKGVTSLKKELNKQIDINETIDILKKYFKKLLSEKIS
jgi:lipoyl(octanoyl) transferase